MVKVLPWQAFGRQAGVTQAPTCTLKDMLRLCLPVVVAPQKGMLRLCLPGGRRTTKGIVWGVGNLVTGMGRGTSSGCKSDQGGVTRVGRICTVTPRLAFGHLASEVRLGL
jgi:hypothetical protein